MVRGLATSVYVKKHFYVTSTIASYHTSASRGKGGLGIYLKIGSHQIALVNVHLPFSAHSLIESKQKGDPMIRQNEVNATNIYFNDIVRVFTSIAAIFFGDFNYRNGDPRSATTVVREIASGSMDLSYDELTQQMRTRNIYPFLEGVENRGPSFIPTCKLVRKELLKLLPTRLASPITRFTYFKGESR